MSNMSYCRFQNTVKDLQDCYDDWETTDKDEEKARKRLVKLCKAIVDDYGDAEG